MGAYTGPYIPAGSIEAILCNRVSEASTEEYLVRWKLAKGQPPRDAVLSWHSISELKENLDLLQDYLEVTKPSLTRKKRKHRDNDEEPARASPAERLQLEARARENSVKSSRSSPVTSLSATLSRDSNDGAQQYHKVYNGVLEVVQKGYKATASTQAGIPRIDATTAPTPFMVFTARDSHTLVAEVTIREEVIRRLGGLENPPVSLINTIDNKNPSLRFEFIRKNVLGKEVQAADPATRTACTKCKPHMGQGIGCEYSKLCDCLEYAAVNENAKMLPEEADRWEEIKRNGGGDTSGLPKRFPYFSSGSKRGCLVSQYLHSRFPIYECNENCPCGPLCKTRVVQHGRKVRLEIFKTANRGWGLRTKEALQEGQFIDTYRGEIITDAEATRREESSKDAKDSFFYSLDKFAEPLNIPDEELYVIDGQSKGGPTRFINHSCQPNCRQFAVSYNKHDPKVYEIAFFAIRPIAPNEELSFDYLDKDEVEDGSATATDPNQRNEGGVKPTQCLCGAPKCRKWLWI